MKTVGALAHVAYHSIKQSGYRLECAEAVLELVGPSAWVDAFAESAVGAPMR